MYFYIATGFLSNKFYLAGYVWNCRIYFVDMGLGRPH
jgi:hypothetical protein